MSVGGDLPSGCCPEPDFSGIETALNDGLSAITDALTALDDSLALDFAETGDAIQEASQTIVDGLGAKIAEITAAIKYGQQYIESRIYSDLETIILQDQLLEQDITTTTQCDSATDDGSPCSECGCHPCVCVGGSCQSANPQHCLYIGYYSLETADTIVVRADASPPYSHYQRCSEHETEEAAKADAEACLVEATAAELQSEVEQIPAQQPVGISGPFCDITAYRDGEIAGRIASVSPGLNMMANAANIITETGKFGLEGVNLGQLGSVISSLFLVQAQAPTAMVAHFAPLAAGALGCSDDGFITCATALAAFGAIEKVSGMKWDEFLHPYKYAMNSLCRSRHLEPDKAMDAYLAGSFDKELLDTHFAIAGLCFEDTAWMIKAAKSKPEAEQVIMMRHRGIIDEAQYEYLFRQLGYIDTDVPEKIFRISEHLPDIATVTRMVQMDSGDDAAANKLGLDAGVGQLLGGKFHDWLSGNGIGEETIKRFWRAHWLTPNTASLFEFFHRLRDDPAFNGEAGLRSDISDALTNLGITPYWQKHFLAVMQQPLLKRDLRVAYTSGALTDAELHDALRLTGHTDGAVQTIEAELKPARRHAIHGHISIRQWVEQQIDGPACRAQLLGDGFDSATIDQALEDAEYEFSHSSWAEAFSKNAIVRTAFEALLVAHGVSAVGAAKIADKLSYKIVDHQAARDYMAGTISRGTATQRMQVDGMPAQTIFKLLNDVDNQLLNVLTTQCTQGIRNRYVMGEIDINEATQLLASSGVDPSHASTVAGYFACGKRADGTRVAEEKLCHWLYLGILTPADFYQRLLRLGYNEINASLLLNDCMTSNAIKASKEAVRIAKEQLADAEKQQRRRDKATAATERQQRNLDAARKKAAKLRGDRDAQMISAAEKLYKKTGQGLAAAIDVVRSAIERGRSQFGLTLDDALKIVLLSAESIPKGSVENFHPYVDAALATAGNSGLEPTISEVGGEPSVNGSTHPSA
jgi:hypothetical protein